MDELPIFTAALGIEAPWYIKRVYFETVDDQSQLFIEVAHRRRTRFECQGEKYPVYDHQKRRWRHLNFFQHECYLYGDIPRVKTREGNVLLVDVPWAKPGSSFTLLFEQLVLAQIKGGMSARSAGALMGISGKRVFGITDRTEVRTVTMDMSRSYIAGVSETMPQAEITFDRFHIASKMNEAVDKIRRNDDAIKSSRITPLNNWIKEAWASRLEPVMDFVRMLRQHWYGIKAYFKKVASNAFAERVNLKIQEIKRTAKGYRNIQNFITMIYFHLGGLNLKTHY